MYIYIYIFIYIYVHICTHKKETRSTLKTYRNVKEVIINASIGTDLSRQTNGTTPQKTDFTGKLEEDNGAIMLFLFLKSSKKLF